MKEVLQELWQATLECVDKKFLATLFFIFMTVSGITIYIMAKLC